MKLFRILLSALFLAPILIVVAPGGMAAVFITPGRQSFEDFESFANGANPSATGHYTYVDAAECGTCDVTDSFPLAGSKSFIVDDGSDAGIEVGIFKYSDSGGNLCGATGQSLSFYFRLTNGAATATSSFGVMKESDSPFASGIGGNAQTGFKVLISGNSPTATIQVQVSGSGVDVQTETYTMVGKLANVYRMEIYDTTCSTSFMQGTFKITDTVAVTTETKTVSLSGTGMTATGGDTLAVAANANGGPTIYLDNVTWSGLPVMADAMVAVTDLTGFDVDPKGLGLITREDSGESIQSYDPSGTMALRGSRAVTDCTVGPQNQDMVAASGDALVMVICDAGDNRPKFFSIRGYELGTSWVPPSYCAGVGDGEECADDINFQEDCAFDDEETLLQIEDLSIIPLDYSYLNPNGVFDPPLGEDHRAFAVAYTTSNGFVGVFEYTTKTGNDRHNRRRSSHRTLCSSNSQRASSR